MNTIAIDFNIYFNLHQFAGHHTNQRYFCASLAPWDSVPCVYPR